MTAFANFSDIKLGDNGYTEISVLSAIGIMNGDSDGSFKPDNTMTRAEFCAVIVRFLGVPDSGVGNAQTIFTDVPQLHWASGYIMMAYSAGLINGVGDDKFDPESDITYEQAIKIIVSSLGYAPKAASMGGYPNGYIMVAAQEKITIGKLTLTDAAKRVEIAKMLFRALTVPNMEQTVFGGPNGAEYQRIEAVTVLFTKAGIIEVTAEVSEGVIKYTGVDETVKLNGLTIKEDGKIVDEEDNLFVALPTEILEEEIPDGNVIMYFQLPDGEEAKLLYVAEVEAEAAE